MATITGKVHDLTSSPLGINAARGLPGGSVVVATIFNPGRNNENGVYVIDPDERDGYELKASCLRKPVALEVAEVFVK